MLAYCLAFWIALSLFATNIETKDIDCCENPPICKDLPCTCCTIERYKKCKANNSTLCGGDCKPGYHGVKCLNKCPDHCLTCRDWIDGYSRECLTCEQGYHVAYRRCVPDDCPDACLKCQNATHCSDCVPGHYNGQDAETSDHHTDCRLTCPLHCTSCTSHTNCLSCRDSFYGAQCSEVCSIGCIYELCETNGTCKCKTGNTGMYCDHFDGEQQCSKNCLDDACDTTTKKCLRGCLGNFQDPYCTFCLPNFIGKTCESCIPGKYGMNCNKSCPNKCVRCDQDSGHCEVCWGNLIGSTCDSCKPGFYGEYCTYVCPTNCKDKLCLRSNGTCTNGCISPFSGDRCCKSNCKKCSSNSECSYCNDGWYGDTCKKECKPDCKVCRKENGTCLICIGNKWGEHCEECRPGFYGRNCEKLCSIGCMNNTCEMLNGTCRCIPEFYGPFCEKRCPSNCASNVLSSICEKWNGSCTFGCLLGYHGEFCGNACSESCKNSSCNRLTGNCTFGCEEGYMGARCESNGPTLLRQSSSAEDVISGVVGTVVVILAASITGLILIIKRKRRREENSPYYNQSTGTSYFQILRSIRHTFKKDPKVILQKKKAHLVEKLSKMDELRKKVKTDLEIIETQLGEGVKMRNLGAEAGNYETIEHAKADQGNYSRSCSN